MMILHIKRCLPTEYSFPPENPVWCRKNESHFVISCCQDHDFCNAGKRLKLLPQDRAKDQSGKHKSSKSKNSVLCKKKSMYGNDWRSCMMSMMMIFLSYSIACKNDMKKKRV